MNDANASPVGSKPDFSVPEMLLLRGISLRLQTPDDAAMQEALFVQVRRAEFAALGWEEAMLSAFLGQQSAAQQYHYKTHYVGAELYTVLENGQPIGRLYIDRVSPSEIRLVDIIFFEHRRGQGFGTAFLQALLEDARATGKYVGLHVEANNPAKRLYERLGFAVLQERPPYFYMTCKPAN